MRRVLFHVWRLAETVGLRVAPEGPPHAPAESHRKEMDSLLARARAAGNVVDAASLDYPVHELLTHLVEEYGLLLHGTNRTADGAVYAVRRTGFRHEWGNEWLRPSDVTPVLRVLVRPSDFPLREVVRAARAPGAPG